MTFEDLIEGQLYGFHGGDYDYYRRRGDKLFGLYSNDPEEFPVEITEEFRGKHFYKL